MKRIPLTQGKYAIVDDEDFEGLSKYKWYALKGHKTYYAVRGVHRNKKRKMIFMHREILGLQPNDGTATDHINHNGLDNRRCKIRICTHAQNTHNRLPYKMFTSKYKGVSWDRTTKKWRAKIMFNYKNIHLGFFEDEIEAAKAYDKKAKELFGEFAYMNFTNPGLWRCERINEMDICEYGASGKPIKDCARYKAIQAENEQLQAENEQHQDFIESLQYDIKQLKQKP